MLGIEGVCIVFIGGADLSAEQSPLLCRMRGVLSAYEGRATRRLIGERSNWSGLPHPCGALHCVGVSS